jgi:acyl dehydratase
MRLVELSQADRRSETARKQECRQARDEADRRGRPRLSALRRRGAWSKEGSAFLREGAFMQLQDMQARIGEDIGTSDWFDIGQDRIDRFADATEDHQFIHVDPEKAKASPFGQTIAHGFLTLSMLAAFMESAIEKPAVKMSVNYGFDKVRFLSPVKSGKRIRGHFKLLELAEKRPGQWQQKVEVSVEIEGEDKPALLAEWIFQHFV